MANCKMYVMLQDNLRINPRAVAEKLVDGNVLKWLFPAEFEISANWQNCDWIDYRNKITEYNKI